MSRQNLEIARRANVALNEGDWDTLLELFAPDVEWRDLMHAPDVPEVLHGLEELRPILSAWTEAYDEFRAEVIEFIDADPWVICDTRWTGTGKGSGAPVEVRSADAYELRDGKIVRAVGGCPDVETAKELTGSA